MSELNYQSLDDCHESGLLNIWADADDKIHKYEAALHFKRY